MGSSSEELLLKIAGDSSGGQDAVRSLTEALTGLSSQLTQSGATSAAAGGHVAQLGQHSENATLSVYQLRSSLRETFEGNFEGAVKNLASSIGADLEGGIALANTGLIEAAGSAAALAGALGFLAERAIVAGEALQDFSYKTSISVEAASALDYAATVAGSSLDQMGSAIFMLQKRMADDSSGKFAEALDQIHLSVAEIQALTPDEQFLKIAEAFRENTTQADRASVAMALFGRAGRDLAPLLMKDLSDLTNQAKELGHVMSAEDAKGAEELGMAWRALKESISWAITDTGIGVLHFFEDLATKVDEVVFLLDPFAEDVAIVGARLQGATPHVKDLTAALSAQSLAMPSLDDAMRATTEMSDELAESLKKHKVAAEHLETIYLDLGLVALPSTLLPLTELGGVMQNTTAHAEALQLAFFDAAASVNDLAAAGIYLNIVETDTGAVIGGTVIPMFTTLTKGAIPDATAAIKEATKETASFSEELTGSLEQALNSMPNLLARAFTSGGGLSGAVAAFGSKFGADLGKSILGKEGEGGLGDTLTAHLGETLGGAVGAAVPVLGALIGPLIGKLFGMFGPSAQELEGRKVEATFEQQFGSFQKMMDAVGAAYAATGRSSQQAQADVLALMNAEKQGGQAATDAANKIKQAFTDQTQDAADLTAAVQRYGFSLAELGPTMQKQQLDTQAQQLINDWRLLVQSGIDVVNVDAKMASSVQDYLTKARQTGQEVPAAMKPILQSLIDQGKLTDENGAAITDMKQLGVSFSESMTEGFQKVVDKLQQLLEKIGMVPAAIAAIPRSIDVTANVNYNDPGFRQDLYAARGGFVPSHGIAAYLGTGGFPGGPSGTDTIPAWLTPGEGVLNVGAMQRLGRAGLDRLNRGVDVSKLSSSAGIVIHAPVTVEGNVLTERDLFDAMGQHFADTYSLTGGKLSLNK